MNSLMAPIWLASFLENDNASRTSRDQIPPDFVVKSQGIDIIGLILPLIRGQNVVETSRRHMKSRFELLSPSKGNWFTT